MLAKFRTFLVSVFIHLTGVRFYSSETLPVKSDIQKFVVTTLHGYEITFTFYKESLSFTKYSFKTLKRYSSTVYVVTANFDELAPTAMRKYNNIRICINDRLTFLSEDLIVATLLNVYLDYLINEMNNWVYAQRRV